MAPKDDLKAYFESHPRMIGALFTVMLLLSQSGTVMAGASSSNPGP